MEVYVVQDTLPPKMASWHIVYFKLKEFEKWYVQEELSDRPLKQVIRLLCEGCLLYIRRKEHPYLQK